MVVLELPEPLTVRRTVALSTAVTDGEVTVQGMRGVLVASPLEAIAAAKRGDVAVLVAPELGRWAPCGPTWWWTPVWPSATSIHPWMTPIWWWPSGRVSPRATIATLWSRRCEALVSVG